MADKKYEQTKQIFESIIKKGVQINFDNSGCAEFISDEDMINDGFTLPPDDMYQKIMSICESTPKKHTHKFKYRRLIAAAVAVAILICGMMSVSAVRIYFFRLVSTIITDKAVYFNHKGEQDDINDVENDDSYKAMQKNFGKEILVPTYLPEGFALADDSNITDDWVYMCYRKDDLCIKIEYKKLNKGSDLHTMIDTKYAKTFSKRVAGFDVTFTEYVRDYENITWYSAIWCDENICYKINTNLSIPELEKIIRGLR